MNLQTIFLLVALAGFISGFTFGFVAAIVVGTIVRKRRQWRKLYQIEQEDRAAFAEMIDQVISDVEKEQKDES